MDVLQIGLDTPFEVDQPDTDISSPPSGTADQLDFEPDNNDIAVTLCDSPIIPPSGPFPTPSSPYTSLDDLEAEMTPADASTFGKSANVGLNNNLERYPPISATASPAVPNRATSMTNAANHSNRHRSLADTRPDSDQESATPSPSPITTKEVRPGPSGNSTHQRSRPAPKPSKRKSSTRTTRKGLVPYTWRFDPTKTAFGDGRYIRGLPGNSPLKLKGRDDFDKPNKFLLHLNEYIRYAVSHLLYRFPLPAYQKAAGNSPN